MAAVLGVRQAVERGLVVLEHPEDLAAFGHDAVVAVQHLRPGLRRAGQRLAPGNEVVYLAEVILDQAGHDVFLGLEVVIERGLGDVEPFRDLPQRGLVITLLGEQLQSHGLDALPGVRAGVRLLSLSHRFRASRLRSGPGVLTRLAPWAWSSDQA